MKYFSPDPKSRRIQFLNGQPMYGFQMVWILNVQPLSGFQMDFEWFSTHLLFTNWKLRQNGVHFEHFSKSFCKIATKIVSTFHNMIFKKTGFLMFPYLEWSDFGYLQRLSIIFHLNFYLMNQSSNEWPRCVNSCNQLRDHLKPVVHLNDLYTLVQSFVHVRLKLFENIFN